MRAHAVVCLAALCCVMAVLAGGGISGVSATAVSAERSRAAHGHGHRKHHHRVDRRPPDLTRYHTADQLFTKFRALAKSCPYVTVGSNRGASKELVTVRVSNPAAVPVGGGKDKLKVLMFFGEHARELISPETALRFTQMLCGETPSGHSSPDASSLSRVTRVLENADVLLFPVINVDGHNKVVRGSYCTRTNSRGVDLNRNWDDHWKKSRRADTNGGPHAFSEDEVRILRDAATEFNPDMFVSIHSGALGMYTPYAYSTARPSGVVEKEMVHILKRLNPSYCNCDVGAAGKQLNYLCPGTCLDYVFDKLKTPYAFAVEIWEGGFGYKKQSKTPKSPFEALLIEAESEARIRDHAHAHAHGHDHSHSHSHSHSKRVAKRAARHAAATAAHHTEEVDAAEADALSLGSCFLLKEQSAANQHSRAHSSAETADESESESASESGVLFPAPSSREAHTCLSSFNPTNTPDYVATTDNWSHALIAMIERVLETDHRAPTATATAAAQE